MTASLVLSFLCILLVPLAFAGLALIHQGLGRSRSAGHSMLASLCACAVAVLAFVSIGSRQAGTPGGAAFVWTAAGIGWNWLGAGASLLDSRLPPDHAMVLVLELFAVVLAVYIPVGAGTDRWRLAPLCLSSAVLAGFSFPLFAHWAWGGGWLAQLPTLFDLPAFVDYGGAASVQVLGGLAALSAACLLGPRRGKYTEDEMATAIPGHNIVLVLFGCLLALVGWIGLEVAASTLVYRLPDAVSLRIVVNAAVAAAAGALAALSVTAVRYRKPDASLTANGWIAGLVAASAGAGMISPLATLVTAAIAGTLVTFLVELFELHVRVDDPAGSISVHAAAGIWGLLAAGLFGEGGTLLTRCLSQCIGIATLLGAMLPLLHLANLLIHRLMRFRVDADGDWQGMDIRELGAGAYPEFVIHADEFVPR